jgi:hypothetical protein
VFTHHLHYESQLAPSGLKHVSRLPAVNLTLGDLARDQRIAHQIEAAKGQRNCSSADRTCAKSDILPAEAIRRKSRDRSREFFLATDRKTQLVERTISLDCGQRSLDALAQVGNFETRRQPVQNVAAEMPMIK